MALGLNFLNSSSQVPGAQVQVLEISKFYKWTKKVGGIFVSSEILIIFFLKEKAEEKYWIQKHNGFLFGNSFMWLLKKKKAKYRIFTL